MLLPHWLPPIPSTPDLALYLAQCSSKAYAATLADVGKVMTESDLTVDVVLNDGTNTRGFIGSTAEKIVISLKGTASLSDWKKDAEVAKRKVTTLFPGKTVWIHDGFCTEFNAVWATIANYLNALPATDKRIIYVTGHSLGGALATLVAAAVVTQCKKTPIVFTYGSPRVGNYGFACAFDAAVPNCVRVMHDEDLVPRVPRIFYWHVCYKLHLDKNGNLMGAVRGLWKTIKSVWLVLRSDFDGESIKDHFINAYIGAITKYAAATKTP